ncbi:hypothetical protein L6R52_01415 [Myxococcota bacterium]|nr:hypothetical protein [Myxococcota bacterium]
MQRSSSTLAFLSFSSAATILTLAACAPTPEQDVDSSTSFYALAEGIDGVYFHPPLGPGPTASGPFDPTLLDGLSITIEQQEDDGGVTELARFDRTTTPRVSLIADHERYFVNIPASTYLTDPTRTYQIRAFLDGAELGTSVMSAQVFTVMARHPGFQIGVHLRIDGTDVVRAVRQTRGGGGGRPIHCGDGVQNKDETGPDCGGSQCAPCTCPTTGGVSSATAGCGWYYEQWRMDECIDYQLDRLLVNNVLVAVVRIPHPSPTDRYPWVPLWVGHFCPLTMPHAVAQGNDAWRCYSTCPSGTTQRADGSCACN